MEYYDIVCFKLGYLNSQTHERVSVSAANVLALQGEIDPRKSWTQQYVIRRWRASKVQLFTVALKVVGGEQEAWRDEQWRAIICCWSNWSVFDKSPIHK